MKSAAPALTLCCLLLAAILVAAGGVTLARREHTARVSPDRKALISLGGDLQAEIKRLDEVYDRDLADLVAAVEPNNTALVQKLCRGVHGVRVCSILRQHAPDEPVHIKADNTDTISPGASLRPLLWRNLIVIPEARLFDEKPQASFQWDIPAARAPYAFYLKKISIGTGVVLTVNSDEVEAATRGHVETWMVQRFAPARAHDEINRVESPRGVTVVESAAPPAGRPADFVIPVSSRWGTWQILSWDNMVTTHSFHAPTLVISSALAVALVIAGFLLSRAQQRMQQLAEQRVSFVNRVSHELGTPLTNMLLNLDLSRELVESAPAEARLRLGLVEEETRRLARLTANVLTFSRGERGALQLQAARCVPDEVLAQVLEHFTPALTRRGFVVETQLDAGSAVMLDADALAQITANLVSNAEKYAAAGASLRIESAVSGDRLCVRVADRGPGIAAAERERIFRPFERLGDQVNEGATGAGLGLSIARDLAQRMGGTLRMVDSKEGSVFELQVRCCALESDEGSVRESLRPSSQAVLEATV